MIVGSCFNVSITFANISVMIPIVRVSTRKAFDVTNTYKSLFHRKCTVAAAHNLSAHVFSSIGNTWKNLSAATSRLFTDKLKHFLLYHFQDLKGFTLIYNL